VEVEAAVPGPRVQKGDHPRHLHLQARLHPPQIQADVRQPDLVLHVVPAVTTLEELRSLIEPASSHHLG